MKQLNKDEIVAHSEQIENSLRDVVELDEESVKRVMGLLAVGVMQCWLLLRDEVCIGYAITECIYDNPANKNLLLIYMLKTHETATSVEVHKFYNELLDVAKAQQCAALTFYTTPQNEAKLQFLRKYGAIIRNHYYIAV